MSTLKVTNIQATGETASRAVSGVAAAWVNFNGTGTIAARDSVNTSSLTDLATGRYQQNYSSNMLNGNHSVSTSSGNDRGNIESVKVNSYNLFEPIESHRVEVVTWNNISDWYDTHFVLLQSFGDLA